MFQTSTSFNACHRANLHGRAAASELYIVESDIRHQMDCGAGQHAVGTEESLCLPVSQSGCGEHYLSDCIQSIVQFGRGGRLFLGCSLLSSVKTMVRPYPTYQKQLFRKRKECVEKPVWLTQNFVLNPR